MTALNQLPAVTIVALTLIITVLSIVSPAKSNHNDHRVTVMSQAF